jgi:hypothetical protein
MIIENDDGFIAYCEVHLESPRAAFTTEQIARLYNLAGRPTVSRYYTDKMSNMIIDCKAGPNRAVVDKLIKMYHDLHPKDLK